jgi:hypothetical protein
LVNTYLTEKLELKEGKNLPAPKKKVKPPKKKGILNPSKYPSEDPQELESLSKISRAKGDRDKTPTPPKL